MWTGLGSLIASVGGGGDGSGVHLQSTWIMVNPSSAFAAGIGFIINCLRVVVPGCIAGYVFVARSRLDSEFICMYVAGTALLFLCILLRVSMLTS